MQVQAKKEQRILYVDLLRIFSIYLMMLLHISSGFTNPAVGSPIWHTGNIYCSSVRCCVPLFLMISGIFFLNPNKNYTFQHLLHNNIKRLTTAFLFWSVLYALYACYMNPNHQSRVVLKQLIQQTFVGHYHMWFLFTLITIYFCVPLLRVFSKEDHILRYALMVSFVCSFLLPDLALCTSRFTTLLQDNVENMHYSLLGGYAFYFLFGYKLYKQPVNKKQEVIAYILGLLGVLATIFLTYFYSKETGNTNQTWYGYIHCNVLFPAVAVFIFFQKRVSKWKIKAGMEKCILLLSSCSFGMYLFHDFLNAYFVQIGGLNWTQQIWLVIPAVTTLIFVVSFIVSFLLSKLPILHKYIL